MYRIFYWKIWRDIMFYFNSMCEKKAWLLKHPRLKKNMDIKLHEGTKEIWNYKMANFPFVVLYRWRAFKRGIFLLLWRIYLIYTNLFLLVHSNITECLLSILFEFARYKTSHWRALSGNYFIQIEKIPWNTQIIHV